MKTAIAAAEPPERPAAAPAVSWTTGSSTWHEVWVNPQTTVTAVTGGTRVHPAIELLQSWHNR